MAILVPDPTYDRLLQASLREAEAAIVALVEREFADLPLDATELPFIGDWPYLEEIAVKKRTVAAALLAKKSAEFELPRWALPLLLKTEHCIAMFNGPHRANRRSQLRGEYGLYMRERRWKIEGARPFERFCAGKLGG